MKLLFPELMARVAVNTRYASPVRTRIQKWVDLCYRFNVWYLDVGRYMNEKEEPFSTLEDKESDALDPLEAALKSYRSYPKGKSEERILTAVEESIKAMSALMATDDQKPKRKKRTR